MAIQMLPRPHRYSDLLASPLPMAASPDAWRVRPIRVAGELNAGEYSLLDPSLAEPEPLPRDGLLSLPLSEPGDVPIPVDSTKASLGEESGFGGPEVWPSGLMETFGFTGEASPPPPEFFTGLRDVARAAIGLDPGRTDLVQDGQGNIHAPEVKALVDDIVAATKAEEPTLRRRIDEMFRGEPRTANWFHQHLSDLLAGDPPEDILESLSFRADERNRDRRQAAGFLGGLVNIRAVGAQPTSRPFTHLNDPVPPDPNMERFRRLLFEYEMNKIDRAWQQAATADPAFRKTLRGRHWNQQGAEFEILASAYDQAYGRKVGPRLQNDWRKYDYTFLDTHGNARNSIEAKSGYGKIPRKQREFDRTAFPPVIYRTEKEVLSRGPKMLLPYDRLWMLRNPPVEAPPTLPSVATELAQMEIIRRLLEDRWKEYRSANEEGEAWWLVSRPDTHGR